jgi:hypothetical protein
MLATILSTGLVGRSEESLLSLKLICFRLCIWLIILLCNYIRLFRIRIFFFALFLYHSILSFFISLIFDCQIVTIIKLFNY